MKVRVQSARSGSVRSRARASMGRAALLAVMLLAAACSAQDVAENIANQEGSPALRDPRVPSVKLLTVCDGVRIPACPCLIVDETGYPNTQI